MVSARCGCTSVMNDSCSSLCQVMHRCLQVRSKFGSSIAEVSAARSHQPRKDRFGSKAAAGRIATAGPLTRQRTTIGPVVSSHLSLRRSCSPSHSRPIHRSYSFNGFEGNDIKSCCDSRSGNRSMLYVVSRFWKLRPSRRLPAGMTIETISPGYWIWPKSAFIDVRGT
jgi:hypothetical protein